MRAGLIWGFHHPPNSDTDYRTFNACLWPFPIRRPHPHPHTNTNTHTHRKPRFLVSLIQRDNLWAGAKPQSLAHNGHASTWRPRSFSSTWCPRSFSSTWCPRSFFWFSTASTYTVLPSFEPVRWYSGKLSPRSLGGEQIGFGRFGEPQIVWPLILWPCPDRLVIAEQHADLTELRSFQDRVRCGDSGLRGCCFQSVDARAQGLPWVSPCLFP